MKKLHSYNPATGEEVGTVQVTAIDDIAGVVSCAHSALDAWRAVMLKQAADKLIENSASLGELLSKEMGKPLARGRGEVNHCGDWIHSKIDEMQQALQPETLADEGTESTLFFDPFGVAAIISPWNYPMSMPQWMVIPSLMAGNAVVLKPSEETPLIAQAYVDCLNEFLPENVLQIIHGADEQGKTLVSSDVQFIAFTGSRSVGKHILKSAADKLKRVVLELGGKDPLIVLADADIDAAASYAVGSGFENAGQMCVSVERIFCAEEIADEFEAKVADLVQKIKIGPWDDPEAAMGPMINQRQRDHVIGQIDEALGNGARALCGGADHPDRFVKPTVLVSVTDDMSIMKEETFGPVVAIARFDDIDDAVFRANDNPYALGGAVFGVDEARAWQVARQLEAGMIGVNKSTFGAAGTPWIGARESGYGFHGSIEGHRQFTQRRVISRNR
jgi:succinate-semialdehyde dehydrogenase/glutarate-semialdehyde dehydrogenase